mgnify:CR=1 FL=1
MGNNEIDEDVMPVFLINGFLEAGKTQFLQFTMGQDYFQAEGKTLLICCEEGELEYEQKALDNVTVVTVDEETALTCSQCKEWEKQYKPNLPAGTRADGVERHVEPG